MSRTLNNSSFSDEESRLDWEDADPLFHTRSSSPTVAGRNMPKCQAPNGPYPNKLDIMNQITDADPSGFDTTYSETRKITVGDTRTHTQVVQTNRFHLFFWLAAAPTASTSEDCSPAVGGMEQERKEGITFTLDNRGLLHINAQIEIHLKKRNNISQRAYSHCPSKSLEEVETWAAQVDCVKDEDDEAIERDKHDEIQKEAPDEGERLLQASRELEEGYQSPMQKEERLASGTTLRGTEELAKQKRNEVQNEGKSRIEITELDRRAEEARTSRLNEALAWQIRAKNGKLLYPRIPKSHVTKGTHYGFMDPNLDFELPSQEIVNIILKLSRQLFGFFFPLTYSSSMTNKDWGGTFRLLHVGDVALWRLQLTDFPSQDLPALKDFGEHLQEILVEVRHQVEPLAQSLRLEPPPGQICLPIEFTKAWIHLLTFWTLVTTRSFETLRGELDKCLKLIMDGRSILVRSRIPSPLETYEAVLPAGIVSLLVNRLVGEINDASPNVEMTYRTYMACLEQEVYQKPYNRGHHERITSVKHEINCALAVLEDQQGCIKELRSTLMTGRLHAPSGFPQRREAYILQNCLRAINDRIQSFYAMDEKAEELANFNLRRIESNKDRQESAILIFTFVTIIFLPLSFVSSFFGMNTSDIRGMSSPQGVFWAFAIPLTLVVLGTAFFLAKNIESLRDLWYKLSNRWKSKSSPVFNLDSTALTVPTRPLYPGPQGIATGLNHHRPQYGYDEGTRRRDTASTLSSW
ncbi:MAG: hypothetical protein Q9221_006745 [Calogaya cf. arnoldii]